VLFLSAFASQLSVSHHFNIHFKFSVSQPFQHLCSVPNSLSSQFTVFGFFFFNIPDSPFPQVPQFSAARPLGDVPRKLFRVFCQLGDIPWIPARGLPAWRRPLDSRLWLSFSVFGFRFYTSLGTSLGFPLVAFVFGFRFPVSCFRFSVFGDVPWTLACGFRFWFSGFGFSPTWGHPLDSRLWLSFSVFGFPFFGFWASRFPLSVSRFQFPGFPLFSLTDPYFPYLQTAKKYHISSGQHFLVGSCTQLKLHSPDEAVLLCKFANVP
jgi:hypothetical protein